MDVTINKRPIDVPAEIATWGELLNWLETDYLKAGQCITHVFLGSAETLNYRDPLTCDQDLKTAGMIAVESGDFDTVVNESLEELDRAVKAALVLSGEIIRLLENRQEEEAYNRLVQLLDSIRVFYAVFSEDLGWSEAADVQISRAEFSTILERALTQLIAAQENRMWVSICDVLEYEIVPVLESWQKLVEGTLAHVN
ncbi:MAG TPA: hypothetical protein VE422_14350 [Terriglobia bacterium]|nr:hypothetical protein [Terriglobia bacterium]